MDILREIALGMSIKDSRALFTTDKRLTYNGWLLEKTYYYWSSRFIDMFSFSPGVLLTVEVLEKICVDYENSVEIMETGDFLFMARCWNYLYSLVLERKIKWEKFYEINRSMFEFLFFNFDEGDKVEYSLENVYVTCFFKKDLEKAFPHLLSAVHFLEDNDVNFNFQMLRLMYPYSSSEYKLSVQCNDIEDAKYIIEHLSSTELTTFLRDRFTNFTIIKDVHYFITSGEPYNGKIEDLHQGQFIYLTPIVENVSFFCKVYLELESIRKEFSRFKFYPQDLIKVYRTCKLPILTSNKDLAIVWHSIVLKSHTKEFYDYEDGFTLKVLDQLIDKFGPVDKDFFLYRLYTEDAYDDLNDYLVSNPSKINATYTAEIISWAAKDSMRGETIDKALKKRHTFILQLIRYNTISWKKLIDIILDYHYNDQDFIKLFQTVRVPKPFYYDADFKIKEKKYQFDSSQGKISVSKAFMINGKVSTLKNFIKYAKVEQELDREGNPVSKAHLAEEFLTPIGLFPVNDEQYEIYKLIVNVNLYTKKEIYKAIEELLNYRRDSKMLKRVLRLLANRLDDKKPMKKPSINPLQLAKYYDDDTKDNIYDYMKKLGF